MAAILCCGGQTSTGTPHLSASWPIVMPHPIPISRWTCSLVFLHVCSDLLQDHLSLIISLFLYGAFCLSKTFFCFNGATESSAVLNFVLRVVTRSLTHDGPVSGFFVLVMFIITLKFSAAAELRQRLLIKHSALF